MSEKVTIILESIFDKNSGDYFYFAKFGEKFLISWGIGDGWSAEDLQEHSWQKDFFSEINKALKAWYNRAYDLAIYDKGLRVDGSCQNFAGLCVKKIRKKL